VQVGLPPSAAVGHASGGRIASSDRCGEVRDQLGLITPDRRFNSVPRNQMREDCRPASRSNPGGPPSFEECGTGSSSLTPRQLEVLGAAAHGLTRDAIAYRLGISSHTVDALIAGAFDRLGVRSIPAAVWAARRALEGR
jgi:DNA-binding CsgD family transcriptional regulator